MEVQHEYSTICTTCLSSGRDLYSLTGSDGVYHVFRLLMHDFADDRFGESIINLDQLVCWECYALMKRFIRFKSQVHSAQEHLRILAMSRAQETMDHTYISQSLSSLEITNKNDYDNIYLYYTEDEWPQTFIVNEDDVKNEQFDLAQATRENLALDIDEHILEVPEMVLENPLTGVMSRVVVDTDALVSTAGSFKNISLSPDETTQVQMMCQKSNNPTTIKIETRRDGYNTESLSETDMLNVREEMKNKVQYASTAYKCELCIIGFYTQQQVEDHFISHHSAKPGKTACKICFVYTDDSQLESHTRSHYMRHTCKTCGRVEYSEQLIEVHVRTHRESQVPSAAIKIGTGKGRTKNDQYIMSMKQPKSGDLRRLLSKTTIEGYQCLECDMFFKNSRARKSHVARYHREGFQCDHCKKRFVNRTTLVTHLRLHEGPLPREECPICHKMVRVIQLKYHVQRHQNKCRYECKECNKVFSHMATYRAHYKYSRAHATESVFKFPCPMCSKAYPSKESMQDHFNYQHLGKTSHKCPVCDKPIASRANVEKHMLRMHGQKKQKPRNHVCVVCEKAFTDKKALNQHEAIHSGERPLSCEVCQQTFKQKASLYTHKKRVHKIIPPKKNLEYMEPKVEKTSFENAEPTMIKQ